MKVELIGTGCIGSISNSACSLINQKILVDIPNGTTKILKNMNKSIHTIQTIIITHFHGDHYFDLPFIILEKSFHPDKNIMPLNIIGPKNIEQKTIELIETAFPGVWEKIKGILNINFIEINPGEIRYIEDATIEAVEVAHGLPNAQGYIITIDNQRCAFTGDTGACEGVEYLLSKSKIVIADCSTVSGIPVHMGINDIENYLSKYPDNIIIATHMRDKTKEEAQKLELDNFIVPSDGYISEF